MEDLKNLKDYNNYRIAMETKDFKLLTDKQIKFLNEQYNKADIKYNDDWEEPLKSCYKAYNNNCMFYLSLVTEGFSRFLESV